MYYLRELFKDYKIEAKEFVENDKVLQFYYNLFLVAAFLFTDVFGTWTFHRWIEFIVELFHNFGKSG